MKAQATLAPRGGRIWVRTARPMQLDEKLPARWNHKEKVWTLGLSLESCRALREVLGADLEVMQSLWDWAKVQREREKLLGSLTMATAADVPNLSAWYPNIVEAMATRPYQAVAARFIADARTAILADDVGLGKTLEAIGGVLEADVPGPYLIVAPSVAAQNVWPQELATWAPEAVAFTATGSKARRDKAITAAVDRDGWLIINKEMLTTKIWWECQACSRECGVPRCRHARCGERYLASSKPSSAIIECHPGARYTVIKEHRHPELFSTSWGAVIMDESHEVLIRRSHRPNLMRAGAGLLQTEIALGLSATPMRGKPQQLWGTLNWLRPKVYTAYWPWVQMFWQTESAGRFGGTLIGALIESRKESLDMALNGVLLRRTRQEVMPWLPEKQRMGTHLDPGDDTSPVAVWLDMNEEQREAYETMQELAFADFETGRLNAVGSLAKMTRLKQLATAYGEAFSDGSYQPALPSAKYDWLVQFLRESNIIDRDPEEPVHKVVIASQFVKVLRCFAEQLMEDFDLEVVGITGEVTGAARTEAQDRFNDMDSGVDLMFIQTKTGGVAITLDSADDMVVLDETHDPDDQVQLEGRIDNRRPEEKVANRRYWYLKSRFTVEEDIARVNAARLSSTKEILDGRRGKKLAEAILGLHGRSVDQDLARQAGAKHWKSGKIVRCPECAARRNMFHEDGCSLGRTA